MLSWSEELILLWLFCFICFKELITWISPNRKPKCLTDGESKVSVNKKAKTSKTSKRDKPRSVAPGDEYDRDQHLPWSLTQECTKGGQLTSTTISSAISYICLFDLIVWLDFIVKLLTLIFTSPHLQLQLITSVAL